MSITRRFKICVNHQKRINVARRNMRWPEEVIDMRDKIHRKMIDAERTKDNNTYYQYKNQLAILKWVIKENGQPTS